MGDGLQLDQHPPTSTTLQPNNFCTQFQPYTIHTTEAHARTLKKRKTLYENLGRGGGGSLPPPLHNVKESLGLMTQGNRVIEPGGGGEKGIQEHQVQCQGGGGAEAFSAKKQHGKLGTHIKGRYHETI